MDETPLEIDYKRNPEAIDELIKKVPTNFLNHAKNENIRAEDLPLLNPIEVHLQRIIQGYIKNSIPYLHSKVQELNLLENQSESKEPAWKPQPGSVDISALQERYLLIKQKYLRKMLLKAKEESQSLEDSLASNLILLNNVMK